jgi:hypothetical protein
MRETRYDVLIVGGGTGGTAAALAATSMGLKVILTEETDWIGGQLTAQAVPPDEHPWIESFGCTARYRAYRDEVRRRSGLKQGENPRAFNPGGGWVSNLCHHPALGHAVLSEMVRESIEKGLLEIRLHTVAQGTHLLSSTVARETGLHRPEVSGDRVEAVPLIDLLTGEETLVRAKYFLDATELGDLLPLTGTEYVEGAESRDETEEPNAPSGPARPENQQGFTWCMAVGYDAQGDHTIEKPAQYERWTTYAPQGWRGLLFQYGDLTPATNAEREMPLFSDDWRCWFKYRQIEKGGLPVTIVNWPQNDYFVAPLTDCTAAEAAERLEESRQLSLSWLYWMQTEGGAPGLFPSPLAGTPEGFAKTPYIRESRRIRAKRTIREQDVTPQPGLDRAPHMADSVGVGAYRIDLHFSTGGDRYIDVSSLPFQISLGALVPQRMQNLLPACKNLGTTHITNGCYRLHPVEWNIGEAAGYLAGFCLQKGLTAAEVWESPGETAVFRKLLHAQGVETEWPVLRAL